VSFELTGHHLRSPEPQVGGSNEPIIEKDGDLVCWYESNTIYTSNKTLLYKFSHVVSLRDQTSQAVDKRESLAVPCVE
jgi:hypothetical protein